MNVNDTSSYHRHEMDSLGWELTVCNMLEDPASPARSVLKNTGTFGSLLFDFLQNSAPLYDYGSVCEIGGGYGYIMRDFLKRRAFRRAAMIDISPWLLDRQRETLAGYHVEFIEHDFFTLDEAVIKGCEVALLNENIGDFPTLCDVTAEKIRGGSDHAMDLMQEAARLAGYYQFPLHEGIFHFNIGALLAAEKLCRAGVKLIYMSEHSCEASPPDIPGCTVSVVSEGRPERISLKGHDEYSIQFSYLEKIAASEGYRVVRGSYADIMSLEFSDRVRFILNSSTSKDEHEIIRHFIEDVYKYEYIVAIKK